MKKIENRISKAQDLVNRIVAASSEVDPDGTVQEMVREDTVTDVLAELLVSLRNGESLEQAILTIHENF